MIRRPFAQARTDRQQQIRLANALRQATQYGGRATSEAELLRLAGGGSPPLCLLAGCPDPSRGGGQFWLVSSGTAQVPGGSLLSTMSVVFVAPEDPAATLIAGERIIDAVIIAGGLSFLWRAFPS